MGVGGVGGRIPALWEGCVKRPDLLLLLLLAATSACARAPHGEAPSLLAAIDRNADGRVDERDLAAFMERHGAAGDLRAGIRASAVARAIVAACDQSGTRALATGPELDCLAAQRPDAVPGPAIADLAAHRSPRSWPERLALVGITIFGVLLAPVVADRVVRMLGWFLKEWTRGAWFRLPPAVLWSASLVTGLATAALVAALLVHSGAWWPAQLIAIGPFRVPRPVRPLDVEWLIVGLVGAASLYRGHAMTAVSRRIVGLEAPRGESAVPAPDPPVRLQPKRIVICCDGTGNRADAIEEGRRSVSNVRKFYERVIPHAASQWDQVVWYDEGVATETSGATARLSRLAALVGRLGAVLPARVASTLHRLRMIGELAFGLGITENITQGYREIVARYEPGDHIFLIGFSRGAYTARSIAGVISRAGILRADRVRFAADVVQLYRYRRQPEDPIVLRSELVHRDAGVEFLGLWDTVSSLGVPLWGWSFSIGGLWSNQALGTSPAAACRIVRHAISIDEERSQFMPTLFDESLDRHRRAAARGEVPFGQDVRQVWFRGSHAGVGGGYADTDLSNVALEWMMDEAAAAGLRFAPESEPRPDPLGQIYTQLERQPFWQLSGSWPRWHPCAVPRAADPYPSAGFGVLHPSVVTRATHAASLRQPGSPVGADELQVPDGTSPLLISVRGDRAWNRTGVVLERGRSYRLTYVDGVWRDQECPSCGPRGQEASGWQDMRRVFGWGRRYVGARWMELVLHVAHPRPWPLRELPGRTLLAYMLWRDPAELLDTLIPAGRHLASPGDFVDIRLECPDGMLYAFANDWWLAYRNNSGSVRLGVQPIDEATEPHFVVRADGTVWPPRLPSGARPQAAAPVVRSSSASSP
jgi:uncharacterized protein (DUF2235 family)